jgi:hypothetical protein
MKKFVAPANDQVTSPIGNCSAATPLGLSQGTLIEPSLKPSFFERWKDRKFFMKSTRFERNAFFALLFMFTLSPSPTGADAIVLRNGNRIEAQRVWEEDGDIKCDQYGGVVGFPKREVLRIEQEQSDEGLDGDQKKALSSEKIKAHRERPILSEARQLYLELMRFKNDPLFHKVGFAAGNKYSDWLDRVGKLSEDSRSKSLLKKGIPLEDLRNLGLEYFKSGGKETSFSSFTNGQFRRAFDL